VSVTNQVEAVVPHILLLHSYGLGSRELVLNYPSWSISAEFFAYLLFPALMFFCRKTPVVLVVSVLLLIALAATARILFGAFLFELQAFGLPRIFPEFLLGIALYLTVERKQLNRIWLLCIPVLVIIPLLILESDLAFVLAACACIAILYMTDAGAPQRGLQPLVHLGAISYSIYMVHALVEMTGFKVLEKILQIADGNFPLTFLPLTLLVIVAAGHCCWRFVERPGHRLLLGYGIKKEAPPPL
jgi:peptidoglycan/LPS O-acetylase OafA/YrhL